MRRVVITGMGAITPVGLSVEEFWNSVKEGKTNFAEVTRFDSTNYRAHMAAEINNFNPKDYMDFKSAKRMELFSQYAVAAAKEAIEQSGLDMTKEDPFRVGCSVGSGIGSMQVVEKSCEILNTKGPGRLNPLMIPLLISNMASGNVAPVLPELPRRHPHPLQNRFFLCQKGWNISQDLWMRSMLSVPPVQQEPTALEKHTVLFSALMQMLWLQVERKLLSHQQALVVLRHSQH